MFTSLHSLRKETFTHDPDSFYFAYRINTVKPLLSGHLRDLPSVLLIESVRLIRVVKICNYKRVFISVNIVEHSRKPEMHLRRLTNPPPPLTRIEGRRAGGGLGGDQCISAAKVFKP